MKSVRILVVIVLVVFMAAFTTTAFAVPLPNATWLSIDQGVGSGTDVPCSTGSCFSMLTGSHELWTDIGPGADGGIVIGSDQVPGDQTQVPALGDAGALTAAWVFFSNFGTFATAPFSATNAANVVTTVTTGSSLNIFDNASCATAAACLNKTTIGTWHVAWNGVAVPMGSGLGCLGSPVANCLGVTSWTLTPSPATVTSNSTYDLHYTWVVPTGDPSGFGDVKFTLILRGAVVLPDCDCCGTDCPAPAVCKAAAICNPLNGLCEYANLANGTLCNADQNKCTGSPNTTFVNDSCTNGACVAGPLKSCDLGNPCKTYGVCIPSTGNCSIAANKPVGTACNDNNLCTTGDACNATGTCVGTPKNCNDNNVCSIDSCDTTTGNCINVIVPNCPAPCPNPLQPCTVLTLTQGKGSATNVPCSVGSCVAMDQGPGNVVWTDFGPGTDTGFVLGKSQISGGQEVGSSTAQTTPGQISAAWNFFSNYGTFFTSPTVTLPFDGATLNKFCGTPCSSAACIGNTELKVFNVAWNGNVIPMGSQLGCTHANCSIAELNNIFVNDWQINPVVGGAWSMNYTQVVPSGTFTGVKFTAIMRGTVTKLGPCGQCSGQPNGTACNDNDACTINDVCTNGVCGGTAVVCTASDQCHVAGTCTAGVCSNPMAPVGTICNDGNACTVADYCQGGVCTGVPIVCVPPDQCHLGVCDTTTGICSFPLAPTCSFPVKTYTLRINSAASIVHTTGGFSGWGEGDLSIAGTFQAVVSNAVITFRNVNITVTPPDPFAYRIVPSYPGTAIQTGTGYTFSGSKAYDNSTGGGNFSGTISGTTFSMSGSFNSPCCDQYNYQFILNGTAEIVDSCATMNCNDNNPCTIDSCDSATGNCVHRPVQCVTGSSCDPATCSCVGCIEVCYTCTSDLDCSGNGRCVQGTCIYTSSFCKGDACNNATCDPASGCVLTPISCDDNNVCTTDTCNPATGCVHTLLSGGTCNDGNACTVNDSCQSGICTGVPVVCVAPDPCHIAGVCNTSTGVCGPGTPKNCNDNNVCTTDTCDTSTGNCVHTPILCCPDDPCNPHPYTCDPVHGCPAAPCVPFCTALDQCHVAGTCDSSTGVCNNPTKPNNTACNDGNACTINDTCQNGICTAGTPLNCNDNNACTTDYCDPATGCNHKPVVCPLMPISVCETQICDPVGGCLITPVPNGTSCDDGQYCNGSDTCSGGTCVHSGNPCPAGTTCDETTDVCLITDCTGKPAGTQCTDNNACTTNDKCVKSGKKMVCAGTPKNCDDGDKCTKDSCDPTTGTCVHTRDTGVRGCR